MRYFGEGEGEGSSFTHVLGVILHLGPDLRINRTFRQGFRRDHVKIAACCTLPAGGGWVIAHAAFIFFFRPEGTPQPGSGA